jgi:RimJ/RimL family protein N-acetyltransferase
VGTAALEHALTFAFEVLRVNKVTCEVLGTNVVALKWYLAHGFVTEGVLRQHLWRSPNWVDLHLLAIFAADWRELRPRKAGE